MNQENRETSVSDFDYAFARKNVLEGLHRLKSLRKAASSVKDCGDEMFAYSVKELAHECYQFINIASAFRMAVEKRNKK